MFVSDRPLNTPWQALLNVFTTVFIRKRWFFYLHLLLKLIFISIDIVEIFLLSKKSMIWVCFLSFTKIWPHILSRIFNQLKSLKQFVYYQCKGKKQLHFSESICILYYICVLFCCINRESIAEVFGWCY